MKKYQHKLKLTKKRLHICELVEKRLTSKEIGAILGIKEKSVKSHLSHIYKITNCTGRRSLIEKITSGRPLIDVKKPSTKPVQSQYNTPTESSLLPGQGLYNKFKE